MTCEVFEIVWDPGSTRDLQDWESTRHMTSCTVTLTSKSVACVLSDKDSALHGLLQKLHGNFFEDFELVWK